MLFESIITCVLLHNITLKRETIKTSFYIHNYNTCKEVVIIPAIAIIGATPTITNNVAMIIFLVNVF
jgi:hypothetical protein